MRTYYSLPKKVKKTNNVNKEVHDKNDMYIYELDK